MLGRFENHRKFGRKRCHLRCPLAARDDCDLEADLAAAVACGVWLPTTSKSFKKTSFWYFGVKRRLSPKRRLFGTFGAKRRLFKKGRLF